MERIDNMTLEEEWLSQILAQNTKNHHLRGLQLFKEYLGENLTTEELVSLKQKERNFETRVVLFYKWLQSEKKVSSNTARSYCIALQSLFSYAGVPLRLKNKLPSLHMKIEAYRPTVEDLQKLYAYGDLQIKAWISLSRDCPARISDLLAINYDQIQQGEFLLRSKKEGVVGKIYISTETQELFQRCKESHVELPKSQRGIDKLLERGCKLAGIPKINQHLLRKTWFSVAVNIGVQETILKILMFKSVPKDSLTYYLDRNDLGEAWSRIVNALPLVSKTNGKLNNLENSIDLVTKAFAEMLKEQLRKQGTLDADRELTDEEVLQLYLKVKKNE